MHVDADLLAGNDAVGAVPGGEADRDEARGAPVKADESAVVWLGEPGSDDRARVGGKTAGLAPHALRYSAEGSSPGGSSAIGGAPTPPTDEAGPALVPPGFCLPAGATVDAAEVAAAYAELGRRSGKADPPVAVRSSAVDEDGAGASFAGVYETFLNVIGAAAVVEAVQRCRASAADPRVGEYRRQRGISGEAAVAVLVQELVTADASAVVFTADPVTRDRERVVINATWGLGEALVGGVVNPDVFVVAKAPGGGPGEIIEHRAGRKETMTVAVPGGTADVGVPRALASVPCLDDGAVLAAAGLALELEATLGHACDVECAWAGGRLYLLQCRPVTTLENSPGPEERNLAPPSG